MQWIQHNKEDLETLRRLGFSEQTISRLFRLRRTYQPGEMDQVPLDPRRLEFARWLVMTHRISDFIGERDDDHSFAAFQGFSPGD